MCMRVCRVCTTLSRLTHKLVGFWPSFDSTWFLWALAKYTAIKFWENSGVVLLLSVAHWVWRGRNSLRIAGRTTVDRLWFPP